MIQGVSEEEEESYCWTEMRMRDEMSKLSLERQAEFHRMEVRGHHRSRKYHRNTEVLGAAEAQGLGKSELRKR